MIRLTSKLLKNAHPTHWDDPGFKSWFQGSKVVDPKGNPLMVFHGTGQTFKKFDPKSFGLAQGPQSNQGFWFTKSNYVADWYAEGSTENTMLPRSLQKKQRPQVYPVYLQMRNPLEVYNNMTSDNAFRKAKADGNDGIIFYNADEGGDRSDTYVVFNQNQIRSAITPTKDKPAKKPAKNPPKPKAPLPDMGMDFLQKPQQAKLLTAKPLEVLLDGGQPEEPARDARDTPGERYYRTVGEG